MTKNGTSTDFRDRATDAALADVAGLLAVAYQPYWHARRRIETAAGGTYTFYIWARVASGTRRVSIAIVDNPYAAYLAGPTQITRTTSCDDWTTGDIHLWCAWLQQDNDPQKAYARTWASQAPHIASGLAAGPTARCSNSPPTANSSSAAAPATATASPNSRPRPILPSGLACGK